MRLLDRIRAKLRPINDSFPMPESEMNGDIVPAIMEPEVEQEKTPKFHMPFVVGEYIPLKGLVLKIENLSDENKEVTLKVVGITNSRAKKLGLA